MWIIIEGPTCSGKSTLYGKLEEKLRADGDVNTIHMGRPEELTRRWSLNQYVLGWEDREPKTHILADRWHWGERTYAPIYRPDTDRDGFGLLGKAGWRWTEMFLASRGAVVAYLTADHDTLARRLEERGDDHVTNVEELINVARLYEVARRESNTVAAIHDTSPSETSDERYAYFIDSLLEEAQRRADDAARLADWPGYTGAIRPDVLLIGDTRNITDEYGEETRLPFMPVNGNSGEFLLNALPDMFWRSVGIINGAEVPDIEKLWNTLGQPTIVALGNHAEACLLQQDFSPHGEFVKLPHPQWARRFHHGKQTAYGRAIQQAAITGKVDPSWTQPAK